MEGDLTLPILDRIVRMIANGEGTLRPGVENRIRVYHDDWCPALTDGPAYCACEPQIELPDDRWN